MELCEANRDRIFAYLDGELRDGELTELESHLSTCEACRNALDGRRRFVDALRSARPLDPAPDQLRARIQNLLARDRMAPVPRGFFEKIRSVVRQFMASLAGFRWTTPQWAGALVLLLTVLGGVWIGQHSQRHPLSPFVAAALRAHQDRLRGVLPVTLKSSSATAVSAWFAGKVPFHVKLPDPGDLPGGPQPYQIEGAGVLPSSEATLGYVAYRVGNKAVSLLIAPASAVTLSGAKQVPMKSLLIHYDSAGGFHIVTWAVPKKGVTYALVSDSSQHANQSCIVCHASPKDRDFMRGLLNQ